MLTHSSDVRHLCAAEGIYDVPEAARYLKASDNANMMYSLSSPKLIRWIRRGLASPELTDVPGHELLIGFEDLISMRVVAALRAAGVSLQDIHKANLWLRDHTGCPRPFAIEALWIGQGQVFTEWAKRLIRASKHGQIALDLLWRYVIPVHGLVFDKESRMAISWEPLGGIVLEPRVQFGAPCLKGTRIPTRTVAGMVEAGDSADWVAQAFDISLEQVRAACDWESHIQSS